MKQETEPFQPAILPEIIFKLTEQLQEATPESRYEAALNIVKEYFDCYHVYEVRNLFWQMFSGSLSSGKSGRLKKSSQRYELIFFYEFTLMLIDAAFVLEKK